MWNKKDYQCIYFSCTQLKPGTLLMYPTLISNLNFWWAFFSKTLHVDETLTIKIKPGWKKGTKITFPEKGHEEPYVVPADLIFVVDEKPHNVYKRDGNDLVVTQKISLNESLTGYTINLTTLDGRNLNIPINDVIRPGYEKVVPNEGMPLTKEPGKKGNLRIKFDIKFPRRLTAEKKLGMKN